MNQSPYSGSTPGEEYYYAREQRYATATPSPSPRHYSAAYYAQTPQRPSTRAHFRHSSTATNDFGGSPRPPTASPRYTSDGYYATANVSGGHHSRKASWSTPAGASHRRERRSSYVWVRSSSPHGDSDEDEILEIDGRTYVIRAPARSGGTRRRPRRESSGAYVEVDGGFATDRRYYEQGGYHSTFDQLFESGPRQPPPRPSATPAVHTTTSHSRRNSTSVPQRPATVRPGSSHHKKAAAASTQSTTCARATDADAKKHKIPPGYSLKNWDPTEEPILLLGSVFDANSLGKWIYDWTVYHQGPATPISDMAGELWLLLIQLAGKVKRAEETVGRVRDVERREIIEDFIDSGERLMDKLRKLLKSCEAPMLKAAASRSKNKEAASAQLGKNAGVEFVDTLFGRERELEKTEKFMQGVRLFNLRFDANCDDILRHPTK